MLLTLVSKLKVIRDARMRASVLAEHLTHQSAEAAVDAAVQIIASSVRRGDAGAELALASLAHVLSRTGWSVEKRRDISVLAKRGGHEEVARLFLQAAPPQAGGASSGDPLVPERPLTPERPAAHPGRAQGPGPQPPARDAPSTSCADPHPDVIAVPSR